jgi:hypothetical protein
MLVSSDCSEEIKSPTQKHTKHDSLGELSRKSVFDIANRHTQHDNGEPLVIVDSTDPTALQSPEIEDSASSASEIPLVAPKTVVEAYHNLTDKFGFHTNENRIRLGAANNVQYDAIIDTGKHGANYLVDEINNLTQTRTITRHL